MTPSLNKQNPAQAELRYFDEKDIRFCDFLCKLSSGLLGVTGVLFIYLYI